MLCDARCVLDPKITVETLPFFEEDIRMAWGALCSRNRGVFVTDPPDGHTYGCANLPEAWGPKNVNEVHMSFIDVHIIITFELATVCSMLDLQLAVRCAAVLQCARPFCSIYDSGCYFDGTTNLCNCCQWH
jgi:hypothetical protein